MVNYKILAWSASKLNNDYYASPIIYIKPDESFKKYASDNNYKIYLSIVDTNSTYDNITYIGHISTSENIPCYRPNYFKETGQYVITLNCAWVGFTPKLGSININNMIKYTENYIQPNEIENYMQLKSNNVNNANPDSGFKLNIKTISIITICILIGIPIFVLLLIGIIKLIN